MIKLYFRRNLRRNGKPIPKVLCLENPVMELGRPPPHSGRVR